VELIVGDGQGREQADAVAVEPGADDHQPSAHRVLDGRQGLLRGRLLGPAVAHQLDEPHRTQPAHVSHSFEFFQEFVQSRPHVRAHPRSVVDQFALEQLDCRVPLRP